MWESIHPHLRRKQIGHHDRGDRGDYDELTMYDE